MSSAGWPGAAGLSRARGRDGFIAEWAAAWDDCDVVARRDSSTPGTASSSSLIQRGGRRPRGFQSRCASLRCGRSGTGRWIRMHCTGARRGPRSRGAVGARRSRRLLSLRDTARAMSQENVELVRGLSGLNEGDWNAVRTIGPRRGCSDLDPRCARLRQIRGP